MRKPFWGETLVTGPREDTVPPVLIYADLHATADARCIEAAQNCMTTISHNFSQRPDLAWHAEVIGAVQSMAAACSIDVVIAGALWLFAATTEFRAP